MEGVRNLAEAVETEAEGESLLEGAEDAAAEADSTAQFQPWQRPMQAPLEGQVVGLPMQVVLVAQEAYCPNARA